LSHGFGTPPVRKTLSKRCQQCPFMVFFSKAAVFSHVYRWPFRPNFRQLPFLEMRLSFPQLPFNVRHPTSQHVDLPFRPFPPFWFPFPQFQGPSFPVWLSCSMLVKVRLLQPGPFSCLSSSPPLVVPTPFVFLFSWPGL